MEVLEIDIKTRVIPEYAYANNNALVSVMVPDKVRAIRDGAFCGCCNLETIKLPPKLRAIRRSLFQGCTNLREIIIPDSVERIDDFAFFGCKALQRIVIPNTVKLIGIGAFAGCDQLDSHIIPEEMRTNAFSVPFKTTVSDEQPFVFTGLYYVVNGNLISYKYPCNRKGEILLSDEQEKYQISFDCRLIWNLLPEKGRENFSWGTIPHGMVQYNGNDLRISFHNISGEKDDIRRQVFKEFGINSNPNPSEMPERVRDEMPEV